MKSIRACIAATVLTTVFTTAAWCAPMAMATYGESYRGPKTLTVELAATAKGDQALIKVRGINHAWDNKVILTEVRKDAYGRLAYVAKMQGKDYIVLHESKEQGSVVLYLLGEPEMRLSFDKDAALAVKPQHILTDYERPEGAVK